MSSQDQHILARLKQLERELETLRRRVPNMPVRFGGGGGGGTPEKGVSVVITTDVSGMGRGKYRGFIIPDTIEAIDPTTDLTAAEMQEGDGTPVSCIVVNVYETDDDPEYDHVLTDGDYPIYGPFHGRIISVSDDELALPVVRIEAYTGDCD